MDYSRYTSVVSAQTRFMQLKINENIGGQYIDSSGNDLHATITTIDDANDGLQLSNNADLIEYIRQAGLYDMFYDSSAAPISVKKSQIGRIYNNRMFNNDEYLVLYKYPVRGADIVNTCRTLFGEYDSDALTIINAIGVTSEVQKRLVDTHVKDLKALNTLQANFFKYNDIDNSVIKELHPMVGDTFDQVKYNWIKATDEDSSFRLKLANGDIARSFINSMFFDSTFCLDTNFNAFQKLGSTNSFSYYSIFSMVDAYINRYITVVYNENRFEMGCLGVSGGYKGISFAIQCENVSHAICNNTYQNPNKGVQFAEIFAGNYYLTNKLANDNLKQYRQGVQIGSTVVDAGESVYYNGNVILGGYSIDGVIQTTKNSVLPCGYYHIGDAINENVLTPFQDAVIRLISSKNYYYFPIEETDIV